MAFMPMHKGMDAFLSDEHYARFYWPYLLRFVDAWVEAGVIPYVYTEAKYGTRLKFLRELPKGKTVVHFEDVDPLTAKKALGDVACISGFYPARLLTHGTKRQVIDKAKEIMDICAPGGGFIFGSTNSVQFGANTDNYLRALDIVREKGNY
jgi:hypothetical protein